MFVASPRDSDEWRPNEDINQPQEISRMSAPIEPQGTGYLTDEEMAQIRQQADAAWAMSQPSLPAPPTLPMPPTEPTPTALEVSILTKWQSPIIALFEYDPRPAATPQSSPSDDRRDGPQWRDDSIEQLVHSCCRMAHDFAASLRDLNRQVTCTKIRHTNHQLICQALTEAANFAEIHDRLQARAAAARSARL